MARRCEALQGVSPIVNSASARAARSSDASSVAHVVDALRLQTVQLGNLRDPDGGLVEHAVHAGRTVDVRSDLGDEQQAIGHCVQRYRRHPKPGGCGKGNTSPRPVRAIDWYRRRA